MRGRSSLLVLASGMVVVGCGERQNPAGPSAEVPSAMISDGRFVGGNDDFFFLPPLLGDPKGSPSYDAGAFNARLGPTVSVCQLAANPLTTPTTDCDVDVDGNPVLVASFASNQVGVSINGEQYHINWHTNDSNLFVDRFYRLQVFLGSTRIGFADIDPVSSGRDLKNANTGEVIPLVDGRTLPVKFRIERGVLCTNKSDCGEFHVTDDGGTFVTNTKFAGIRLAPGFLPDGVEEITLKIQRIIVGADNRCHGPASSLLWKEYEGCYEMTSDPDLGRFGGIQQAAIAAQCTEVPSIDPLYDFLQPYKSKNGTNLTRLANAEATFIDCEGFEGSSSSTAQASSPAFRFAAAGLRRIGDGIGKLFGVGTLHAIDLGLGEELPIGSSLSRFNWAIGLEAEVSGGAGQSAGFGLPTAQPLEVHIKSLHFHSGSEGDDVDDEHREDVPGVEVTFTVIEGDGHLGLDSDLTPLLTRSALTDARGRASVSFTAASNSTGNLVTATLPTFGGGPMTFSIAGLPPDLVIENLTRSITAPKTTDGLSWNFDARNVGQGVAIPSTARLRVSFEGEGTEEVASFDIPVPRLLPGAAVTLTTPTLAAPRNAGGHRVSVAVDPDGQVTDADDANNAASEVFTVVPATGILSGTVMDTRTAAPLAGVNVAVVGQQIAVVTNDVGRYRLLNVQPGAYTLRASFIGYSPVDRTVTLTAGNEVVTDFSLEPNGNEVTGSWVGSYTFGSMSATFVQTGSAVVGEITDAASCVWTVSGSVSGNQLGLPSWTLKVGASVCLGASAQLSGVIDNTGDQISGTGTTVLADGGGTFPWTFSLSRVRE